MGQAGKDHSTYLISVVICTRNRAVFLDQAIGSVVSQRFPRSQFEIVVVDNASTDRTREVAQKHRNQATLRYVFEPRVGIATARNAGWRAARGYIIAYLDDDTIAFPGWLAAIRKGFRSAPARTGAIGGRVEPIWEKPRPSWLTDDIALTLAIIDWSPTDKILTDINREWLLSANMAIPRVVLEAIDGFHPQLGRAGTSLLSNEEIHLQRQLMRSGYICLYRPTMAVRHFVPAARLEQRWFYERSYYQGMSDAIMNLLENPISLERRIALAYERGANMTRPQRHKFFPTESGDCRDVFVQKYNSLWTLGYVAGLLGALPK